MGYAVFTSQDRNVPAWSLLRPTPRVGPDPRSLKKYEKRAPKKQNLSVETKKSRVGEIVALPAAVVTTSSHARGGGLYAGLFAISTSVRKRSELR